MPGIEDLTNIMMAGGRPDVPMPPPPQGAPMGGPPPQAGPSGPPPQVMGGPMMANQGPPPPDMMADQIPTEGAAPDIEQDSMALAEAVVGRAQGDIQMAVTILDTAKAMLMQAGDGEMPPPQMMKYGGDISRSRPQEMFMGGAPSTKRAPFDPNLGQPQRVPPRPTSRQMQQQAFLRGGSGRGWNMGGPLYAAQGEPIIDDTEVLKQMIMDEMMQSQSQEGRTLSDKDEKSFRDYQPEGLLKGTIFDYVPDPAQISNWLMDKYGAGRAESDRDRTISDMISDEELRNEMRMLEREEPSEARQRALDELMEYRNR